MLPLDSRKMVGLGTTSERTERPGTNKPPKLPDCFVFRPTCGPMGEATGRSLTERVKGVEVGIVAETTSPDSGLSFPNRIAWPGHMRTQRKDPKSAHQPLWHQEKVTKHGKQSLRPVMT